MNLSTLKGGGGQNVAMNFLIGLQKIGQSSFDLFFLVAKDSQPHKYLARQGAKNFRVAPANPILRILFELIFGRRLIANHGIDIIYTYFGFGLYRGGVPQVCGSADSNLYYPEVDFWKGYSPLSRLKRALVDQYRIWGLRLADAVVFENEDMQSRSKNLFGLKKTWFIKPSVNFDFQQAPFVFPEDVPKTARKALFLCGWQLNKNILLIPELAAETRRRKDNLHFILTAPPDGSDLHEAFMNKARVHGVVDMISVVGPVKKEELVSLYGQVDCVLLLSKLESFSNNIIEAWYFNKPLIVSSEPWARSICKDAAVYADRDSPSDIVDCILTVLRDSGVASTLVGKGVDRLREYPTTEQRIHQEIGYLSNVYRRV